MCPSREGAEREAAAAAAADDATLDDPVAGF